MLDCYHKMGSNMSLKLHFLLSHVRFSPENMGTVSDEQSERFHDVAADTSETHYKRKANWFKKLRISNQTIP